MFINVAQLIQTTKGAGRQCNCFRLTEDKLEDVVVDEVLSIRIAGELERLAEVHGALLLIDLIFVSGHISVGCGIVVNIQGEHR